MAPRWGSLAALMSLLCCLPALAKEEPIGRQAQSWRPRPLSPLLPEQKGVAEAASTSKVSPSDRPAWEAWISRILRGQPLFVFKPTWEGSWPAPENPWSFSLTPGLRGDPSAGFGAEIVLDGQWKLAGITLEAKSRLLWAETTGITAWRTAASLNGLSFELRGWTDGQVTPGALSATAALRRGF